VRRLVQVACFLSALGPVAAQENPAKPTALLTVRVHPGYTHHLYAMQVRSYPLLIVASDGALTASTHPGRPPGAEFRIFSGMLPSGELARLHAGLLEALPPAETDDGVTVVDAPSIEITVTEDGHTVRRTVPRLGLTLDELLRLHELTEPERAAAQRRLAFARMVEVLRNRATSPYRPTSMEILVENADDEKAARVQPWPVPSLDLGRLARECHPDPDRGGAAVPVTDAAAMATLAEKVVSGRRYRAGERVYAVFWFPTTR